MNTNDTLKLYERMLRLGDEWVVQSVELDEHSDILHITICYKSDYWADKSTGEIFPIYDFRTERVWRHLDSMEFQTHVHCRLPRIRTAEGKVQTIEYDWAEDGFCYTKKFENKCIATLQSTHCQKSAADLLGVSDDKICGIMHAAVSRGLKRRNLSSVEKISLDEKSYGKGHQYITVLTDSSTGAVLDVEGERTEESADRLLNKVFDYHQLSNIKNCCCDMWSAYINSLKKTVLMPHLCTINFML